MTKFDADQKSMLEVYLYETRQLFEQLDDILIQSEKKGYIAKEDIHSIFRIMHTTKSSSSMMGLDDIAELMHTVESVFVILRDEEQKLSCCKAKLFDLLYDVSDYMHVELDSMQKDNYEASDAKKLITSFQTIQQTLSNVKQEDIKEISKEEVSKSEESFDEQDVFVKLRYEEEARMENIRAYMIISSIKPYCEKVDCIPQILEGNPEAEIFIKKQGFYIHFNSSNPKHVLEMLHKALFVETCQIISREEYFALSHEQDQKKESITKEHDKTNEEISSVIPVQVKKLDKLQNLLQEMMIAESIMMTKLEQEGNKELSQTFERGFHKIFMDLEAIVMSARLIPISNIVPKLNRVVRDISHKEQKQVTFIIKGEDIEIDKEIVDHLFDPLMHLLRNAIDHGIESSQERLENHKPEQGTIRLMIENNSGEITIHVEDDGRGLDVEKIKDTAQKKGLLKEHHKYSEQEILSMIMMPGFSTKQQATEISGRGVGMDIVKNMVDQFRGNVSLSTKIHHGTRITLHLPLTLSIIESMLFIVGTHKFAIPSYNILRYFAYEDVKDAIQHDDQYATFFYNEKAIPLIDLKAFFGIEDHMSNQNKIIIHLQTSQREAFIVLDKILGYQHIVDKPLPSIIDINFKKATGISGCSLLGDGSICMSLNIDYILDCYLGKDVGIYE